jgi:predicted SpoU family rRNA methylase
MSKLIQFEIHFSVMISAKKIIIIVPTDKTKAEAKTIANDDVSITDHPRIELIKYTIPILWINAKGKVAYLVYCWICFVHCSPIS